MTDREHRIDTGSPEERVKAKWPDAYWHKTSKGFQIRCTRFAIMRRVTYLLSGWRKSEYLAWESAASRLETK